VATDEHLRVSARDIEGIEIIEILA